MPGQYLKLGYNNPSTLPVPCTLITLPLDILHSESLMGHPANKQTNMDYEIWQMVISVSEEYSIDGLPNHLIDFMVS
jgi:hypothetical protein